MMRTRPTVTGAPSLIDIGTQYILATCRSRASATIDARMRAMA